MLFFSLDGNVLLQYVYNIKLPDITKTRIECIWPKPTIIMIKNTSTDDCTINMHVASSGGENKPSEFRIPALSE